MPAEVKFDIGHVLFIDIVGYSKLLINEQSEQIQNLKQVAVQEQKDYAPALRILGSIGSAQCLSPNAGEGKRELKAVDENERCSELKWFVWRGDS